MSDGHVDEIQQRSIGAALPEGSRLFQFVGDLDQMIDFCHRAVPLWQVSRRLLRPCGVRLPAPRHEARLQVGHSISPQLWPANHEQLPIGCNINCTQPEQNAQQFLFRKMQATGWRETGKIDSLTSADESASEAETEGPFDGGAPLLERLHEAQPRHLSGGDDVGDERGGKGPVPRPEPSDRQSNPEPLCRRRDRQAGRRGQRGQRLCARRRRLRPA